MITDRPCCENCPHYDAKRRGLDSDGEWKDGCCTLDPPRVIPGYDGEDYHNDSCAAMPQADPGDHCGHHPWIEAASSQVAGVATEKPGWRSEEKLDLAESWRYYVEEFAALRDMIGGAKTEPGTTENGGAP